MIFMPTVTVIIDDYNRIDLVLPTGSKCMWASTCHDLPFCILTTFDYDERTNPRDTTENFGYTSLIF